MSQSKHTAQSKSDDVSEAEIAVHWQEEAYVPPPEKFVAQANLTDPKVFDRFSLKIFQTASKNTPICSTGIRPGTSRSTPANRHSGNGLSAAE